MANKQMTEAQINHLRRLLGWIRCEIGQSEEEMKETLQRIKPAFTEGIGQEGYDRLEKDYEKAVSLPKYVRAAIKSLEKIVKQQQGEIVDADVSEQKRIGKPVARIGKE